MIFKNYKIMLKMVLELTGRNLLGKHEKVAAAEKTFFMMNDVASGCYLVKK